MKDVCFHLAAVGILITMQQHDGKAGQLVLVVLLHYSSIKWQKGEDAPSTTTNVCFSQELWPSWLPCCKRPDVLTIYRDVELYLFRRFQKEL